jgi:UDP-2,3-diacylglucosamine pyrophosphatase LpxH
MLHYRSVFISDTHLGTKMSQPNIREIDGISYINCGDWVETCSAIVEHIDGRMELVIWK